MPKRMTGTAAAIAQERVPAEMTSAGIWDVLTAGGRRTRRFEPSVDPVLIERAAEAGRGLSERLRDRQIQIRKSFVRRREVHQPLPASAALAASRSEVHLKMALTLLWISAGKGRDPRYVKLTPRDQRALERRESFNHPFIEDELDGRALLLATDPYVAEFRLPDYAKLLGLPKPKTAGASRVRRSLDELAKAKLIWVDRTNGAAPRTQLRREDGSGDRYTLPGEKTSVSSDDTGSRAEGRYIVLPAVFFTNGWAATLSARAIAALLAITVQHGLDPDRPAFIAPSVRADRFGLSDDSFHRGAAELVFFDLVHHETAPVQREWSTSRGRVRHAFIPMPTRLGDDPTTHL